MKPRARSKKNAASRIGRLLLKFGMNRTELQSALIYQRDHPQKLLGEICVELGFTDNRRVEFAMQKQKAIRKHAVSSYLDLAATQTKAMAAGVEAMALANSSAFDKLNGSTS